jgi:hypothetical protein
MLVIALRKIKKLLVDNPDIEESHYMMTLHMVFFVTEEVAILLETLWGVLYYQGAINMEHNTFKTIDLLLNMFVASANFCTNAWVAYLMISFCNPEEIGKSKSLFRRLSNLARKRERKDVIFESLIED